MQRMILTLRRSPTHRGNAIWTFRLGPRGAALERFLPRSQYFWNAGNRVRLLDIRLEESCVSSEPLRQAGIPARQGGAPY